MGTLLSTLPTKIAKATDDERGILRLFIEEYEKLREADGDQGEVDPAQLYALLVERLRPLQQAALETMEMARRTSEDTFSSLPEDPSGKGFIFILVVDSCEDSLDNAMQVFKQAFAGTSTVRFCTANNSECALQELKQARQDGSKFNLVLHEVQVRGDSINKFVQVISECADLATCTSVSILTLASDTPELDACHQCGVRQVIEKPFSVRKAVQALLKTNVRLYTAPYVVDDDLSVMQTAWTSPLTQSDGSSLELAQFADHTLFMVFVTSLKTDPVSRNLLRIISFFSGTLKEAGHEIIVISGDSEQTLASVVAEQQELNCSFTFVADASLAVSAAYAGICSEDNGVAAPRLGIVVVDQSKKVIDRQLLSPDYDTEPLLKDHCFVETAATTTGRLVNNFAGVISAAHCLGAMASRSLFGFDIFITPLIANVKAQAFDAAYRTLKVAQSPPEDIVQKSVLVVEDSRQNANAMVRKLLRLGHAVLHASNGSDAFSLLSRFQNYIDCVLTDICMPEMDGVELLSKIKATCCSNISVVLITGHETNTEQLKVLQDEFGAKSVIEKPVTFDQLRDVVDTCPVRSIRE